MQGYVGGAKVDLYSYYEPEYLPATLLRILVECVCV
jgi:hypothetical protein